MIKYINKKDKCPVCNIGHLFVIGRWNKELECSYCSAKFKED